MKHALKHIHFVATRTLPTKCEPALREAVR